MSRLRNQINPALILSMVAIFIALGGGAYAALSANSVGTKQLKKNAVTAKKIKANAVTGTKVASGAISTAKIQNDAVDGMKVLESSLGQVPSAASADSATKAGSLDGYQRIGLKKVQSSASNPSFNAAQAAATEVPLMTFGPVTIYAKCFMVGTSLYAAHYLKTSVNGVIFDSQYDSAFGSPSFLDTGTPEADREIFYTSTGMNNYTYYTNADPTYVITPDGKSYKANTALFAKQGVLPGGDGPYGPGDVCMFTGDGGLN